MKHIFFKTVSFLFILALIFSACKKPAEVEPIADAGTTYVKIMDAGSPAKLVRRAVDFVNTSTTVTLNIQRLAVSNADLNKKMIIKILNDTAAVSFFNRDTVSTNPNATNKGLVYVNHLNPAWYTVGNTTSLSGGVYTMILNPGEFAKDIQIIIPNATLFNPSNLYGLGFTISSVDADGKIDKSKSCVMSIGAKNNYDGKYQLVGFHNRAPYTFRYDEEMDMITSGANSVKFFFNAAGDFGHPIGTSTGSSWYGNTIAPEITFDPVTNLVTSVVNTGGPTPITMFTGAGSYVSKYDPSSKKIFVCWNYNANPLRAFFDTLSYIKPR